MNLTICQFCGDQEVGQFCGSCGKPRSECLSGTTAPMSTPSADSKAATIELGFWAWLIGLGGGAALFGLIKELENSYWGLQLLASLGMMLLGGIADEAGNNFFGEGPSLRPGLKASFGGALAMVGFLLVINSLMLACSKQ